MDVTGLWLMDSHLCSVLSGVAAAARLMGTETLICGMSPEIALTLQAMGLELPNVGTELSLEEALSRLGVGVLEQRLAYDGESRLAAPFDPWDSRLERR